ncbi:hypothetical protein GCM10018987_43800 [Streptomyces cremeus]
MEADNVESVAQSMGQKEITYENTGVTLGRLTADLPTAARSWRPGDDYYARELAPCVFGPAKSGRNLTMKVGWFGTPFQVLEKKWHRAGGNVLSDWWIHDGDSRYAFPCKIRGSHPQQQEQIPLSVRLNAKNLDSFSPELRGRVAATVARTMASQLQCANKPHIPARLTTPPYNPVRSAPSHPTPTPTNSPRYSTLSAQSPGHAPAPR